MMKWLQSRWSEPESRAAAAGILTAVAAALTGTMDGKTAALTAAGCALAFIFPSTPKPPAA